MHANTHTDTQTVHTFLVSHTRALVYFCVSLICWSRSIYTSKSKDKSPNYEVKSAIFFELFNVYKKKIIFFFRFIQK